MRAVIGELITDNTQGQDLRQSSSCQLRPHGEDPYGVSRYGPHKMIVVILTFAIAANGHLLFWIIPRWRSA